VKSFEDFQRQLHCSHVSADEIERRCYDAECSLKEALDKMGALEEFVRDCRDNWDCDEDAHTHNTLCRVCEAEKLVGKSESECGPSKNPRNICACFDEPVVVEEES